MPIEWLDETVQRQKRGEARGIASICSAHPSVLQAAVRRAARTGAPLLVEATCNQVNQFGGYTGQVPADFAAGLQRMARENRLPAGQLLLGGDHLGPSVWQEEPAESAMRKAEGMVQAYVQAGFAKIHLDASMKLEGDDPSRPLEPEVAAQRTARLAVAAEEAAPDAAALRYVIGTEVPLPGGARMHEDLVRVTAVGDVRRSLEVTRAAFKRSGLESAWERIRAVVVQPGVEFGQDFVAAYGPEAAASLAGFIEGEAGLVYEAHSTDYQARAALRRMVQDHFAILKVGPALTFAFRQAVFALAGMEAELLPPAERSNLIATLEAAMQRNPSHWQKHYHGTPQEQARARLSSRSDRIRYYWPDPQVRAALEKLMANLSRTPLPLDLVKAFAPGQYERIQEGRLENSPQAIVLDCIEAVLDDYAFACGE